MDARTGRGSALGALAAELGVAFRYTDVGGAERQAPAEAVVAVLRALGAPIEGLADCAEAIRSRAEWRPRTNPVRVAWNGALAHVAGPGPFPTSTARLFIRYEDGTERTRDVRPEAGRAPPGEVRYPIPCPLPLGIHDLEVEAGDRVVATRVLSAPLVAWVPPSPRGWGAFLPLHMYGAAGTSLPGTYGDLRSVLEWVGGAGGSHVGTLPLLPTWLDRPFEASPYAPVSRLFPSELFVDPAAARRAVSDPATIPDVPLRWGVEEVDYREAWQRLRGILGPMAERFFQAGGGDEAGFRRFLRDRPAAEDYARFRAAAARAGCGWREWPERLRQGRLEPGDFDPADYRFHLFAAWCADEQLTAAVSTPGAARLYLDLPLGVHPDGYDTWRHGPLFAQGMATGAPPDTFFEHGQNWGFPPLLPDAMRADRYRYLIDCLRLQLRFAGALRLDHVMALERLFWVPSGFDTADGVYVRYPRDEMIALLTLESHRHEAMIVGEDLGTVTPSIRTAMDAHAIQRIFVVQLEVEPDREPALPLPGPNAVASLGTHDLPPFAAWLSGTDLEERSALGLLAEDGTATERARRERAVRSLCRSLGLPAAPPDPAATRDAALDEMARGPARLVMVNVEDAWLETRRQNVPGTTSERPNWRCRAPLDTASLRLDAGVAELLDRVDRGRTDAEPAHTR